MNEIANQGQIDITQSGNVCTYNADAKAVERIKSLSDSDFEKEVAKFPYDTQTFLRLARNH